MLLAIESALTRKSLIVVSSADSTITTMAMAGLLVGFVIREFVNVPMMYQSESSSLEQVGSSFPSFLLLLHLLIVEKKL